MVRTFDRLRLIAPADAEEALAAVLWSAGTLGLEMRPGDRGTVVIDAWFAAGTAPVAVLDAWRPRGVETDCEAVEEIDYLARYRASVRPFPVGDRFVIDSRDPDAVAPLGARDEDGRITLRIPARVAFGTGSHETTRLMLRLLERIDIAGRSVLDVGTGSGILSFAALRLGAHRAVGFDLDAASALIAAQNVALHPARSAPCFFAGRIDALAGSARFDVVLVNVLPERVRDDVPRIADRVAAGGTVLYAGALATDHQAMRAAWRAARLEVIAERAEGEWIGFVLESVGGR